MPGLSAASADVPAGESSEHLIDGEPAGAGRLPRLAGWYDPFAAPAERFLLGQQVGSIASQRRASAPVTSGLLEDECISPCPVCAWAGTTPVGSPATPCRTPPSDRPPRRASDDKSWEPAAIRGDSALAPRAPRPPGQGWVARRPPVPKGRHDNHRPEPWPCYAPGSRRGGTTPAAAAMAALYRQMPGRAPGPLLGSQRGQALAEPVIPAACTR
jgi:hypothetical protein